MQQWSCIIVEIKILQWIWKKYKNIIYLDEFRLFNYKFLFEEIFWRFYQNNKTIYSLIYFGIVWKDIWKKSKYKEYTYHDLVTTITWPGFHYTGMG